MIGPIEQSPIRPKVSLFVSLSVLDDVSPIPKVKINGTLINPVVTPLESKAIGINSFGKKMQAVNIII